MGTHGEFEHYSKLHEANEGGFVGREDYSLKGHRLAKKFLKNPESHPKVTLVQ